MCPMIACDNPQLTVLENGCPGCPKCSPTPVCDGDLMCPMIACDNAQPTVLENGCPGCIKCSPKPVCDGDLMSPMIACDNPVKMDAQDVQIAVHHIQLNKIKNTDEITITF